MLFSSVVCGLSYCCGTVRAVQPFSLMVKLTLLTLSCDHKDSKITQQTWNIPSFLAQCSPVPKVLAKEGADFFLCEEH